MAHGVNSNLARRWVLEAERRGGAALATAASSAVPPDFVAVQLPRAETEPATIRIQLRRSTTTINVSWPCAAALDCAAWMQRVAAVIRIDAVWLAVQRIDMRTGVDRLLASVVQVFGAAQAHHCYLFTNARSSRIRLSRARRDGAPAGAGVCARRDDPVRSIADGGGGPVARCLAGGSRGRSSELESVLCGRAGVAIGPLPAPPFPRDGWATGLVVKGDSSARAQALQAVVNPLAGSGHMAGIFTRHNAARRGA